MKNEGPSLEYLTHRLAECPPDFMAEPMDAGGGGVVSVAAVVYDLILDLGGPAPSAAAMKSFAPPAENHAPARRRHALLLIAAWVLHDTWFCERRAFAGASLSLLSKGLDDLAEMVVPARFIDDPDRREEFVRLLLKALNMRPAGETEVAAEDRLASLDSIERTRLIRVAREAERKRAEERRAREIREEAERKKRAAEAAATYGRE
ncbi:MAG: hypothetical protein HQM09_12635 [Candidatus Riflebacteria bacterium]|nr:hypothetical protein [Candidatus Riflebacteria bacterium]